MSVRLAVFGFVAFATAQLAMAQTAKQQRVDSDRIPVVLRTPMETTCSGSCAYLTAAEVAQAAYGAGFRGGALVNSIAVSRAESDFAVNAWCYNCGGSQQDSRGLWQINIIWHTQYDPNLLFASASYNASAAYSIANAAVDANWKPWSAFNSGSFLPWLSLARTAAKAIDKTVIRGVGDKIAATPGPGTKLVVRATAGGTVRRRVPAGTTGTVVDGPVVATIGTGSYRYVWWKVRWDDGGTRGWSAEDYMGRAAFDLIQDDLAVDRGSKGLWVLYNKGTWLRRHPGSPEGLAAGDLDGNGQDELLADRGGTGLWARYNDATWVKLNSGSPEGIATGELDGDGKDEVIADFGNKGLKAYYSKIKRWKTLRNEDVEDVAIGDLDGDGKAELIADLGPDGLWVLYNNNTWKRRNQRSPENIATGDLDGDGKDEIIADFGNEGLKAYYSSTGSWTKLRDENVEDIATGELTGNDKAELIADLGPDGLWVLYNNNTWRRRNQRSPENIATGDLDGDGKDEIIADFGNNGLKAYSSSIHKWTTLRNEDVEDIAIGSFD